MPGRFVDRTRTRRVDFGACECPGTPHESDYADVRAELSSEEINDYTQADRREVADVAARFIVEWNLWGPKGLEPISSQSLLDLMPLTLNVLVEGIAASIAESVAPVPNGSGARSRATTRASASRTRPILKSA